MMKPPGVLLWFYRFTSIGGITHARDSDCKIAKHVWFILFISGCCMTIWGVIISVESYLEFKSVTTVSREYKSLLTFPSVTICNLNRVHCGNLNELIEKCSKDESCDKKELYCKIFELGQCDVALIRAIAVLYGKNKAHLNCINDERDLLPTTNSNSKLNYSLNNDSESLISQTKAADETSDQSETKNVTNVHEFWRYYLKLNHEAISEIAHQPKDMIIGCVFSKQVRQSDPRCTDFLTNGGTKVFTPSYGVCYMFNFKGLETEQYPASTFYPGEEYGLQLTINVETLYYMQSGISEGQGVRVIVENSTKIPFIVSEGINVHPRTSTNIGLNEGKHQRLPSPYPSNCSETYPPQLKQYHNFTKYSEYSSGLCKNLCYVNIGFQACGCYFPYLEGNIPFSPLGKRYCDMEPRWDNKDVDCMKKQLMKILQGEVGDKCKCNPECHETSYKKEISSSYWPTEGSLAKLAEQWNMTVLGHPITYTNFKKIRKSDNESYKHIVEAVQNHISANYLKVNVYFATMKTENIVESPEIDWSEFRNSIGGALALYLGISFVSFFEVVELIVRFTVGFFTRNNLSNSNKAIQ